LRQSLNYGQKIMEFLFHSTLCNMATGNESTISSPWMMVRSLSRTYPCNIVELVVTHTMCVLGSLFPKDELCHVHFCQHDVPLVSSPVGCALEGKMAWGIFASWVILFIFWVAGRPATERCSHQRGPRTQYGGSWSQITVVVGWLP
jgi:hypothetical protein